MLDAMALDVVREMDSRASGSVTEGIVREVTGASPAGARRDVAAARATGPDQVLSAFGEWLAAGRVSREQVDAAVQVLDHVPVAHRAAAGPVVADFLLDNVTAGATARQVRVAGAQLLARLDPDGADRGFDPDADQRRYWHMHTDSTGMLVGRFALDRAAGEVVRAAIARYSAPTPEVVAADGTVHRDERTATQRRADAVVTIADIAAGISAPVRGERPRIVVHATVSQLAGVRGAGAATVEGGDPIPATVLGHMACDAVLQRLTVDDRTAGPLDVGRAERLVTLPQRRALAARDGGCVICGAHPGWCDAHHITPWAAGGATDMDNLVLVCPRHHTAVHNGHWVFEKQDGEILVVPPKHVDPRQLPRPPLHHHMRRALHSLDTGSDPGLSHDAV